MKKMKKFLLPLLCLILAMSMALTACGKDPEEDPDNDPPVTDPGEQPGGEQPGGQQPGGQQPGGQQPGGQQPEVEKPAFTIPEIDLSDWNTIGLKLTDLDVEVTDFDSPADSGVVDASIFELYVTLDEEGMLQGYGKATMTMTNDWVENELVANVYIEDSVIYVAAEGDALSSSSNEGFDVYATVELSQIPELEQIAESVAGAQMMLDTLLPKIENWVEGPLSDVFESVEIDEDEIENFVTRLINSFFKVTENQDGTKTITFSLDVVKEWNETLSTTTIAGIVDLIAGEGSFASFKQKVTSGVIYTYSVADVIEFIETDIGVDLVELIEAVEAFLPTVMELMGAPEVESITIEEFIAGVTGQQIFPEGVTIKGMLENEELLALDVEYALLMIEYEGQIPTDDPATPDVDESAVIAEDLADIKADIANMVAMLETMTVYDIVISMQGSLHPNPESKPQDDRPPVQEETDKVVPVEDEDEPSEAEMMAAMIDQMVDMAGEYFSVVITTDATGVVTDVVISVNAAFADGSVKFVITVDDEKVVIDMEEQVIDSSMSVIADATVEIIPGDTLELTPDANKLDQIQAELAKAPELTVEVVEDIFESYIADYSDRRLIVDTEKGYFYIIDINGSYFDGTDGGGNEYYEVGGTILAIESLEVMAMSVQKGCTNMIGVAPVFSGIRYYFNARFLVPENTDKGNYDRFEFDLALVQNLMDRATDKENVSESYNFVYNTQTGTITNQGRDDLGHVYEETAEDPTSCEDIYAITHTCTVCGDTYKSYTTIGHSYNTTYELVNETAGPLGGYQVVRKCTRQGCTHSYVAATIAVQSELTAEAHDAYGYPMAFKITVTEVGTYQVIGKTLYEGDNNYGPSLRVSVYKLVTESVGEGETKSHYEQIEDFGGGSGCLTIDAEAGDVYLISFNVDTHEDYESMPYQIDVYKVREGESNEI